MKLRAVWLSLVSLIILCQTAQAQSLSLIRDEEIEQGLYFFLKPLFIKAGLDANNMQIHLVKDDSINAFATTGLHVFIHTGLLIKADNAQEVIAVLAHETGHISGGHIVRLYENMRIARRNMLVTMVLGAVAAAASGRGDVASATMLGGMSSAQGLLAGYRQSEENAADQTAVSLLKLTGHDLSGFKSIMEKLKTQESYEVNNEANLWRSHPMVADRLRLILNQPFKVIRSKQTDAENQIFNRIKAKLIGFFGSYQKVNALYKDDSLPSKYAQAISNYRNGRFEKAEKQIDALIAQFPNDPYFYELKGQLLFETGRGKLAIDPYTKAVQLLPNSSLFRIGLAQALLEGGERKNLDKVLQVLAVVNSDLPLVWRLKAMAYGRLGQMGLASYALAEYNAANGNYKQAVYFAHKAIRDLPEYDPACIRSQDILENLKGIKGLK